MRRASGLLAVAIFLLLSAGMIKDARADGDPASDTLLVANVYLPYAAQSTQAAAALNSEVAAVYAGQNRIKVAVVAAPGDLGAIPSLFGQADEYAKFLGLELKFYYVGPLLIVMPSGFGIYDGGRSTVPERHVLNGIRIASSSPDDLVATAATAVGALRKARALRSKDVLAPNVFPAPADGHRGELLRLQYAVFDDSGRAAVAAEVIQRPGRVLRAWKLPLRAVRSGRYYLLRWRVPVNLAARPVSFCVRGSDPSGNRSAMHCSAIRVT